MGNILPFDAQLEEVVHLYPKLEIEERLGVKILTGTLDIVDKHGKYWDSYQIEIHPSLAYPYRFPKIFEVGGKLPPLSDWHIYESDKSCCITVSCKEAMICHQGIGLLQFVKDHVIPYFFHQTFRRKEGYYLTEYNHGIIGVLDGYSDALGIKNREELLATLYFSFPLITNPPRVQRNQKCVCNSGKLYRHCHKIILEKLTIIGKEQILSDLIFIKITLLLTQWTLI